MSAFTVISFFTPDWRYPEYAQNLMADCERLGLNHVIEKKDSTGSYIKNCNIKPNFVRDKLHSLQRPVLWMDVDGSILRVPRELTDCYNEDILGYQNQGYPDRIFVCTLLFNYTPATLDFVDTWCRYSENFIDDGAFNDALQNSNIQVSIKTLPGNQITIIKNNQEINNDQTCFVHRLSNSDLKWQYKHKVEGRR